MSTGTATHHVLCATDDVSTRFEALQEVHGRGPGVQAYQQGAAVHLDTRAPDEDWAGLTAVVVRAVGDLCLDAVPIHVGLEVVGVLTFFRTSEGSLLVGPDALQLVADLVGDVLIADPVNRELVLAHPSWGSRSRVDLAAGMVAVQMGRGTVDGAYALLRAHSYAQEQSLPTTARQVLDGLLSFADGG
ncbi:hypothetical protein GC722_00655 [Auraticoccus sp. F435]|uniref:ANTAR domain-containing protein n=1 Tax=Auraticoccus cholistanensis TaxID=2656650 RepID=A0A6A9US21_9ACTN|nr:ANTAR domain-containing protein [Auraticoccus cholistanensis]MVA74552.1 hypothetical protein [Auraticoccus cholistanensis]